MKAGRALRAVYVSGILASLGAAAPLPAALAPRPQLTSEAAETPAPTPAQLEALERLGEAFEAYEAGARGYRRLLDRVVEHHFEERRRRMIDGLEQEIDVERGELLQARNRAIERLERFIATYSGDRADPESTPDAMLRLAALYEERARESVDVDLNEGLKPAIELYEQIESEFSHYRDLAAAVYYHGHALTDTGRLEEGQQAWRSLVCRNRYPIGSSTPLAQDHDAAFWDDWYNRNPLPLDQAGHYGGAGGSSVGLVEPELSFVDPYAGCVPVVQHTEPGEEPRYLAEIWWQIGNYHFDQLDPGGPYTLARAVSAYSQSMQFTNPPLYGVAMYKRAWAYFKQQRYHAAVDWFVNLLHYADAQEKTTGDPGADFRQEAFTYVAGSLTYVDFEGPPADDPYIPRSDVLDIELDPIAAENKMAIAIERVQDPDLVPQDAPWTVEIYRALGQEFIDITQNRNAIAVLELALERFAMHASAPELQEQVAGLYDQLAVLAPDGSAVQQEYLTKALEARTRLASYVGKTAWTQAHREDPEALAVAEQLARRGLQRAAADHTNRARGLLTRAQSSPDRAEQRALLEGSVAQYESAELAWSAYIEQDPIALDGYESRFWLSDAHYFGVLISLTLGRQVPDGKIQAAQAAIVAIRDSHEDDRYLQPAAYYLVSLADARVKAAQRDFAASGGQRGLPPRESVAFDEASGGVSRLPLPALVAATVVARDAYNASVLSESDPQKNGLLYAFQAADTLFVHGQFPEARERFRALLEAHCGKNEWGYKAWEKLISMSNFEGNAERSLELAEGRSCAFDEETLAAEEAIRKPVRQGVAYLGARALYDAAEAMEDGPERDSEWRKAAAAYRVALDAAPDRDEAPEAAMNGAFAYKQVGEYDKAIAMYELFIERYGSEAKLGALRNGDPAASPPLEPDPQRYAQRTGYLKSAFDALASSYVLFFDYAAAAAVFDKIGQIEHFEQSDRREAVRQFLTLSASLDDTRAMQRAHAEFDSLGASQEELAEAEFAIASASLKAWDPDSPDSGANRRSRVQATRAMEAYYDSHRQSPAANQYVVEAAYWVARGKRAARDRAEDRWWDRTQQAFERFRDGAPKTDEGRSAALGTRQAGFAAEAAYVQIDARLRKGFDYDGGHHRFSGTTAQVLKQYHKAAQEAEKHAQALQRVIDAYASPKWATAALARQGSLYDSLRTGLYNTNPPALKMFDRRTERLLLRAENSDNLELQEQADAVRMRVETAWREARDRELKSTDEVMVARYGTAISLARRYAVSTAAGDRAVSRLAFFTDVIGDGVLAQYASNVPGLNYTPGMFLRLRPGLLVRQQLSFAQPPAPGAL